MQEEAETQVLFEGSASDKKKKEEREKTQIQNQDEFVTLQNKWQHNVLYVHMYTTHV